MNLFLAELSPLGLADERRLASAVSGLLEELPFLERAERRSWRAASGRCAVATAAHPLDQTGGVRYVAEGPGRFATFSGRPIAWVDEFEADGRGPLDPALYLRPAAAWADTLDGRWAALRYDDHDGELEACSDPLGSYPLYWARRDSVWISNSAELVRRVVGATTSRPEALAAFFACGATLDGLPRWDGVDRLPAGVQRFRGLERRGPDGFDWTSLLGETFDPEVAGRRLTAVVRALADWPGRPVFLSLSGGRDSRVVLAAVAAAQVGARPRTMAIPGVPDYPDTADVRLGRELCVREGLTQELIEPRPVVPAEALAPLLALLSPGTISLELAAQAVLARPVADAPLELVETGQCGEVARAYYGIADGDDPAARLVARTMPGLPRPLLTAEARDAYARGVRAWALRQDVPPSVLLDLFYLDQRMPSWIAVSHGTSEYAHDLVNPLASRRIVAQELAPAPEERRAERFHLDVIRELAPELLEVPFDVGRSRMLAKVRRELRRALVGLPGADRLPEVAALLHDADPAHPAWDLLDRTRVRRLLARDPARLDRRSRSLVWRLATVLLVPDGQPRRATPA